MALQSCYECNKKISSKAIICPQCGAPQNPVSGLVDKAKKVAVSSLLDKAKELFRFLRCKWWSIYSKYFVVIFAFVLIFMIFSFIYYFYYKTLAPEDLEVLKKMHDG